MTQILIGKDFKIVNKNINFIITVNWADIWSKGELDISYKDLSSCIEKMFYLFIRYQSDKMNKGTLIFDVFGSFFQQELINMLVTPVEDRK